MNVTIATRKEPMSAPIMSEKFTESMADIVTELEASRRIAGEKIASLVAASLEDGEDPRVLDRLWSIGLRLQEPAPDRSEFWGDPSGIPTAEEARASIEEEDR